MSSNLTMKTPEQRDGLRSGVFTVNFEHKYLLNYGENLPKKCKSLYINVEGHSYNFEHLDCLYLKKKRKKRL